VVGDALNLAVLIFLPVVIQAAAFVVVINVSLAILDGFNELIANLKSK
jgi:hypothetical protein